MEQDNTTKKTKVKLFYFVLNYTLIFILAGFLMYLLHQLVTVYVGSYMCKMPLKWTPYMVKALIPESGWDMYRVKRFFTFGSYAVFLTAIFFVFMFLSKHRKKGLLKIFYLWMAFHGFNLFAGNVIASVITKTGFYFPLLWMKVDDIVILLAAAVAAGFLIFIGSISTRIFLLTSISRRFVESPKARNSYLFNMMVLPWILGSLALIVVKINPFFISDFPSFEWLMALPIGLILIPMFYFHRRMHSSEFVLLREHKHNKINIPLVVITGLVILAYRIIMIDGIRM